MNYLLFIILFLVFILGFCYLFYKLNILDDEVVELDEEIQKILQEKIEIKENKEKIIDEVFNEETKTNFDIPKKSHVLNEVVKEVKKHGKSIIRYD